MVFLFDHETGLLSKLITTDNRKKLAAVNRLCHALHGVPWEERGVRGGGGVALVVVVVASGWLWANSLV